MSFYKTGLRQSKNDTEYDGIASYNHILNKCELGEVVNLTEVSRGKLVFWLNDHCYTGWGNRGKEIVKAYILAERLPESFFDQEIEYTWCVVSIVRGVEVLNKLIPPTDENELVMYKVRTAGFLSQNSLSNKFYENVHKAANAKIYQRAKTFFNRDIRGWKDIVTAYDELMMLTAYAKRMASFGIMTYGCKQRSGMWSPAMNKAHSHVKYQLTYSSYQKADGETIGAFLIRELDTRDAVTNPEDTYALMEYIATHMKFILVTQPMLPTELTEQSLNHFRNLTIDLGDFSTLNFN